MKVTASATRSPRERSWQSFALFFMDGFLIGAMFIRFGNPIVHRPTGVDLSDAAVIENIDVRDLLAAQHDYGLRHPSWRVCDNPIIEYAPPGNPFHVQKLDFQSLGRELVNEIENSVAPGSWVDFGGTVGLISISDGTLIAVQTPQNLRQIHQLLDDSRADVTEWPKGQNFRNAREQP